MTGCGEVGQKLLEISKIQNFEFSEFQNFRILNIQKYP